VAGAEGAGAGEEVVAPHALEALGVLVWGEGVPVLFDVVVPGEKGAVVVAYEDVPVVEEEVWFHGYGDLACAGYHGVGEDVAAYPGVGAGCWLVAADGVQEEEPSGCEEAVCGLEVGAVVFVPDVLEHADGVDAVESAFEGAVVLELYADGQPFAHVLCQVGLL